MKTIYDVLIQTQRLILKEDEHIYSHNQYCVCWWLGDFYEIRKFKFKFLIFSLLDYNPSEV